jgi:hypothetical protein
MQKFLSWLKSLFRKPAAQPQLRDPIAGWQPAHMRTRFDTADLDGQ